MVRCITDSQAWNGYAQAEKHLCADCRPDGWVILNMLAESHGMEEEASVHLRSRDARKLGTAMIQMADELDAR
jgi:hypothetical protein